MVGVSPGEIRKRGLARMRARNSTRLSASMSARSAFISGFFGAEKGSFSASWLCVVVVVGDAGCENELARISADVVNGEAASDDEVAVLVVVMEGDAVLVEEASEAFT